MLKSTLSDVIHKSLNDKPLCGAIIEPSRLKWVSPAEYEERRASGEWTDCKNCEEVASD